MLGERIVNWRDADREARRLGYALPTKAEQYDPKYIRTREKEMRQHKVPLKTRLQWHSRISGGRGGFTSEDLHRISQGKVAQRPVYIFPYVKNAPPEVNRILEVTYRTKRKEGAGKTAAAIAAWSNVKKAGYVKVTKPAASWVKQKYGIGLGTRSPFKPDLKKLQAEALAKLTTSKLPRESLTRILKKLRRRKMLKTATRAAAAGMGGAIGTMTVQRIVRRRKKQQKQLRPQQLRPQQYQIFQEGELSSEDRRRLKDQGVRRQPQPAPETMPKLTRGERILGREQAKTREEAQRKEAQFERLRQQQEREKAARLGKATKATAARVRAIQLGGWRHGPALAKSAVGIAAIGLGGLELWKRLHKVEEKRAEKHFDLSDSIRATLSSGGEIRFPTAGPKPGMGKQTLSWVGGQAKRGALTAAAAAVAGLASWALVHILEKTSREHPSLPTIRGDVDMSAYTRNDETGGLCYAWDPIETIRRATARIVSPKGGVPTPKVATFREKLSKTATLAKGGAIGGALGFYLGLVTAELLARGITRERKDVKVSFEVPVTYIWGASAVRAIPKVVRGIGHLGGKLLGRSADPFKKPFWRRKWVAPGIRRAGRKRRLSKVGKGIGSIGHIGREAFFPALIGGPMIAGAITTQHVQKRKRQRRSKRTRKEIVNAGT